jgi:DNA-binding beta-propeller fold protein YncE
VQDGANWKSAPTTKLHVIDLKAEPPVVIAAVDTGKQPSGLAISRKGDLALVANRADNSVSVLSIAGRDVKVIDTIPMGDQVTSVAITPDGRKALVTKFIVHKVAVLDIDGQKVTYGKLDLPTGQFPYNVDITPDGSLGITADNGFAGGSDGNMDTVTVIDMKATPPRVVSHVDVGDGPEGFAISPKGDLAVVLLLRGSNADKKAFYYNRNGSVVALKIEGGKVIRGDEVEVGGLPEGVAFSPDGKYLYVGNFLDSDLSILAVDGTKLTDTGKRLKLPGAPAALRGVP